MSVYSSRQDLALEAEELGCGFGGPFEVTALKGEKTSVHQQHLGFISEAVFHPCSYIIFQMRRSCESHGLCNRILHAAKEIKLEQLELWETSQK